LHQLRQKGGQRSERVRNDFPFIFWPHSLWIGAMMIQGGKRGAERDEEGRVLRNSINKQQFSYRYCNIDQR
jgi:hypothetical protein